MAVSNIKARFKRGELTTDSLLGNYDYDVSFASVFSDNPNIGNCLLWRSYGI